LRENNLRLLKRIPKTAWENYGMHSERGQESIEHIVKMMAGHDINHVRPDRGRAEATQGQGPEAQTGVGQSPKSVEKYGSIESCHSGNAPATSALATNSDLDHIGAKLRRDMVISSPLLHSCSARELME